MVLFRNMLRKRRSGMLGCKKFCYLLGWSSRPQFFESRQRMICLESGSFPKKIQTAGNRRIVPRIRKEHGLLMDELETYEVSFGEFSSAEITRQ